ncbi:hypothetical protein [Shimia ponticola]|uniref:hypothetical protein n=1 Tax=Shimia ponticola TaxID=2582893 RepID=UPI0011BE0380|nr:hypothetical protein [Shimia ponticola]
MLIAALAVLCGCQLPDASVNGGIGGVGDDLASPFAPEYRGVQTRLLEDNLVSFIVEMRGARDRSDVADYADCAAAQYALIRGFGFARHVRTTAYEEAGIWRGDAVYTVSPTLPRGTRTIDAEVKVADCAEQGIPTV